MQSSTPSPKGMNLGVTLFSFTTEFISRQYSFEQILAKVADLGIGPGVEIIGFQSIRGFPAVSDAFAERFRELMAKYKLVPSCLAINADAAIRRGTMMTVEESAEYLKPQILAAAKLGIPTVRSQFSAPAEAIRRLIPLIEKLNIKIGPEIHAPITVNSPPVMAYREMYAKANCPNLGFVPDFGCAAANIPPSYVEYLIKQGSPPDLVKMGLEIWQSDQEAPAKRAEFARRAAAQGADPSIISGIAVIFSILSRQEASAWLDILPQVIHIHGKFYDFDPQGNESSVPYDKLLPVFIDNGFNGYMSSEWEGHLYSQADAFDMVVKHHALCRRIMAGTRKAA
jgi:sugar phosphate isomerase/epimerase